MKEADGVRIYSLLYIPSTDAPARGREISVPMMTCGTAPVGRNQGESGEGVKGNVSINSTRLGVRRDEHARVCDLGPWTRTRYGLIFGNLAGRPFDSSSFHEYHISHAEGPWEHVSHLDVRMLS